MAVEAVVAEAVVAAAVATVAAEIVTVVIVMGKDEHLRPIIQTNHLRRKPR